MTTAKELAHYLGATSRGSYYTAPCPICQPERRPDQQALSIAEGVAGTLLVRCFKSHCDFRDILKAAGCNPGRVRKVPDPAAYAERIRKDQEQRRRRVKYAVQLWDEAEPITGTVAEVYLRRRGIEADLPDTLRFHPAPKSPLATRRHPAMIARIDNVTEFAVHLTFLDGEGRKAALRTNKIMIGPMAGGAVRLRHGNGLLVVAEGIETGLSILEQRIRDQFLISKPGAVWAALSATNLLGLRLPLKPGRLIVAADPDEAGWGAAERLVQAAVARGWEARAVAPDGNLDFNDVLRGVLA